MPSAVCLEVLGSLHLLLRISLPNTHLWIPVICPLEAPSRGCGLRWVTASSAHTSYTRPSASQQDAIPLSHVVLCATSHFATQDIKKTWAPKWRFKKMDNCFWLIKDIPKWTDLAALFSLSAQPRRAGTVVMGVPATPWVGSVLLYQQSAFVSVCQHSEKKGCILNLI